MQTIKLNDSGNKVSYLQELLLENGFDETVNGTFSTTTREHVIEFQKLHKLDADGIVGIACWDALVFSQRPPHEKLTEEDFVLAAGILGIEPECLKAVQKVETGGRGGFFAPGKPAILFEGHVFWRELLSRGIDPSSLQAKHPDILYPKWETGHYKGGIKEYERLEEAIAIHEEAALSSASWGINQLMGNNYKLCGEKNVFDFVAKEKISEQNQLRHAIIFIHKSRMTQDLIEKNWRGFARKYNGPSYEKNNYHIKLDKAYRELTSK